MCLVGNGCLGIAREGSLKGKGGVHNVSNLLEGDHVNDYATTVSLAYANIIYQFERKEEGEDEGETHRERGSSSTHVPPSIHPSILPSSIPCPGSCACTHTYLPAYLCLASACLCFEIAIHISHANAFPRRFNNAESRSSLHKPSPSKARYHPAPPLTHPSTGRLAGTSGTVRPLGCSQWRWFAPE